MIHPSPVRTPDIQSPSRGLEQGHHPRHAPAAPLLPFPAAVSGAAPFPCSRAAGWEQRRHTGGTEPISSKMEFIHRQHEEAPGTTRGSRAQGVPGQAGCCPQAWGVPAPGGAPQSPAAALPCLGAQQLRHEQEPHRTNWISVYCKQREGRRHLPSGVIDIRVICWSNLITRQLDFHTLPIPLITNKVCVLIRAL